MGPTSLEKVRGSLATGQPTWCGGLYTKGLQGEIMPDQSNSFLR